MLIVVHWRHCGSHVCECARVPVCAPAGRGCVEAVRVEVARVEAARVEAARVEAAMHESAVEAAVQRKEERGVRVSLAWRCVWRRDGDGAWR